ncbi:MAG: HAD hydrolase-like protein [Candidatus Saccharibacteria bacterium]
MVQRKKGRIVRAARRAVIFDFDGTISDSFDYVFDFLRTEAGNTHDFTEGERKQLREMSMKRLALHLGVRPWRLASIYFKGRRVMRAHMEHVKPFPGMDEVLKQLYAEGYELYVASANSGKNIRHLLKSQGIAGYFKAVRGGSGFMGKSTLIRQIMLRYRLQARSTWYVGDETGDVVAAALAGVRCLAVGWGFADPEKLKQVDPAAFADRPADIPKLLDASWKK